MRNPVIHFEVMGKDAGALQSYYSELFGWKLNADNPVGYGVVEAEDGNGIGGGIGATPDGSPGHVTFYVAVEDVEGALERAASLGGTRVFGPETVMEQVEIGLFNDPEGHMVGVVKQLDQG
jgi:predicted enzyme related to lactoylglutathione lyase